MLKLLQVREPFQFVSYSIKKKQWNNIKNKKNFKHLKIPTCTTHYLYSLVNDILPHLAIFLVNTSSVEIQSTTAEFIHLKLKFTGFSIFTEVCNCSTVHFQDIFNQNETLSVRGYSPISPQHPETPSWQRCMWH